MAADGSIGLHWWKAVPNFGDAISAMVVAHVSGRPVIHAGAGKADMFAIGSIIHVARRALQRARTHGVKPWIWGSGMLAPVNRDFLPHVQIAAGVSANGPRDLPVDPRGEAAEVGGQAVFGVGRSLIAPIAVGDIAGFDRTFAQPPQAYAQGIARACAVLKTKFPAPLRAAPHMASA